MERRAKHPGNILKLRDGAIRVRDAAASGGVACCARLGRLAGSGGGAPRDCAWREKEAVGRGNGGPMLPASALACRAL